MRAGKVPHVRRIFNLPAEELDIRMVSLRLDYSNDFTVPGRQISLGRGGRNVQKT